MPAAPPHLDRCVAGLELSATATWALDAETVQLVWANDAAVALWGVASREALVARDVVSGVPEVVMERTRHVFAQVAAGKHMREEWTLYPDGVATRVLLDLRAVTLPSGRAGVLSQAIPITNATPAPLERAAAMSRYSSAITALVDKRGRLLAQNPQALSTFGELDSWFSWFADPALPRQLLEGALADERVQLLARVSARGAPRWHLIDARAMRDPVHGELGVLVEHRDESSRLAAEELAEDRGQRIDTLRSTLALVESQQRAILELSAPLLELGDQTLVVPIIGQLDDERGAAITSKLLAGVAARHVRTVILDVTGVVAIDESSARHLQRMIRALRLLGARPMLSGIRPELARELGRVGAELDGVETVRSLAAALRRA